MTQFKKARELPVVSEAPWDDDVFQTLQGYATFLTNALIADPGSFVLNVNGAWGSGKTFFVRRWAADLRNQGYPVVEFNAWENDAEADPLTCLLAECIGALGEHVDKRTKILERLQKKGGRVAVSLGKIATQAALRRALGDDGAKDFKGLFSKETEKDLIALGGSLVEEQIRKKTERQAFVNELKKLVAQLQEKEKGPVFIFIDELDRCRPTFAIELLERMKHLFNVDGIKFVVSTDSEQLAHSINGAYGASFDSSTYLQRFFDETFNLPSPENHAFAELLFKGIRSAGPDLEDRWICHETVEMTFADLSDSFRLSLRQQAQAFHRIIAVAANINASSESPFHFIYAAGIIMTRFISREDYHLLTTQGRRRYGKLNKGKKHIFSHFLSNHRISGKCIGYLNHYFDFSDGDHDHAIRKANEHAESRRQRHQSPHRPSVEEMVVGQIFRNCCHHYAQFMKYPKLIELTETLSEDGR